jgi:hypothetical protein
MQNKDCRLRLAWYDFRVPALLANIDGIHAILFHVEHSTSAKWFYRWRMIGNYPPPYLVWRDATTDQPSARIFVEARNAEIEVQWRASEDEEWAQVDLLVLKRASCKFRFTVQNNFSCAVHFVVCSPVRADGVGAYGFGPVVIPAGQEVILTGTADAPAWPNVLLAPDEFRPNVFIPGMEITNIGPSSDAYDVYPHQGSFVLTQCPVASARRWFAVGHESVPPSYIQAP